MSEWVEGKNTSNGTSILVNHLISVTLCLSFAFAFFLFLLTMKWRGERESVNENGGK